MLLHCVAPGVLVLQVSALIADLVIFTLWFLSICVLILRTPDSYIPPILDLHTVILDSQARLTALEIAPGQ